MLSAITNYATNIIYFLIFISMVGMIVPGKRYKKYINLCLGLILILVILSPLKNILDTGVPVTKLLAGIEIETDSSYLTEMEKERRDMIKKTFEDQLKEQVRSIAEKEGYEVYNVSCMIGSDTLDLKGLDLLLGEKKQESRGFIRIEPIRSRHSGVEEDSDEHKKIKSLISDFYNIPVDNIYIKIK